MRVARGNLIAIGWGVVYLALAGVIGLELDWGRRIFPSLPAPKPAPAAHLDYPIQPEFALLPLEQGFLETTARPAFIPVRRPPPPPAPPKPAMQKGQFVLLGVLITKEKSIALLRIVTTGKATRVEQGKEINGITVSSVLPERVTLTQYEDSEELVLKIQSLPRPPSAIPKETTPANPASQNPAGATPQVPAPFVGSEQSRALVNARRRAHGLPPL